MNVKEIIIQGIEKLGLDGLVSMDDECWCDIDDLFEWCLTKNNPLKCEPGHKVPCNCSFECDYHIVKDD